MNHVSVSLTNGNGPTPGQRKTLTRVGNEIIITIIYIALFSYSFIALYNDQVNIELKN